MKRMSLILMILMLAAGLVFTACSGSPADKEAPAATAGHEESGPGAIGVGLVPHDEDAEVATAAPSEATDEAVGSHEHEAHEDDHHAYEEATGHGDETAAKVIAGGREITLAATEWAFAPETITVKLGEPVTIVLVNDGIIEHDVEISDFGLHLHTPPGDSLKGSFVPDKTGTFEFACEIPGHRAAGMVGKLVVTQ